MCGYVGERLPLAGDGKEQPWGAFRPRDGVVNVAWFTRAISLYFSPDSGTAAVWLRWPRLPHIKTHRVLEIRKPNTCIIPRYYRAMLRMAIIYPSFYCFHRERELSAELEEGKRKNMHETGGKKISHPPEGKTPPEFNLQTFIKFRNHSWLFFNRSRALENINQISRRDLIELRIRQIC